MASWTAGPATTITRARVYAAQLGRFCSRDSIGQTLLTTGLYEYVRGNPVRALDPTGRVPIVCTCAGADASFEVETQWTGIGQTCCETACGVYPVIRWRIRGIWGPNWSIDIVELCNRIRQSNNPRCCRCGDTCEETFRTLIDAARSLPVPRFGWGTCQRWFNEFYPEVPYEVQTPANGCFRLAPTHFKSWLGRGHAAILVVACERSIFFLNNPIWWGHGCIFAPGEIPPLWNPPDPWPPEGPEHPEL